jgi:hypothetical protein
MGHKVGGVRRQNVSLSLPVILIMGLMTHLPSGCHSESATLSSEGASPRTATPGRHCGGGGCQPEEEHIITKDG